MPLILGTNSIKDTGYDVDNSCRFDDGSNCQMRRAGVDGGDQDKFTLSMWIKRANITTSFPRLFTSVADANDRFEIYFGSNDSLYIEGVDNGSATLMLNTNRKFRDPSAWFHFLLAVDTDQGTASNRAKLWINGVQETSFATETYPSQDGNIGINTSSFPIQIAEEAGNGVDFDGYLAEIVFLDGVQKANTDFGEFDADSPTIWKPKDVSDLSSEKGNNGFYLDFEDSSNLGNDVFGGTDFTVNNLTSADQTPDTCTNNFATLNPLGFAGTTPTFSQGNLNALVGSGATLYSVPTIGVSSGKWYVEGELEQASTSSGSYYVDYGFHDRANTRGQSFYVSDGRMFWLSSWDGKINYRTDGSTTTGLVTGLGTLAPGDFFQLYLDMDNELMYWGKNGSLLNSTGVSFNGKESQTGEYFFAFADQFTSGTHEYAVNFGQGSIDGTAVSNYNDANGYGNFKYNPTVTTDEGSKDFLALCTKNLAEYGG